MDFIKKTWEQQAAQFGTSHSASWKDIFAINLEIETIAPFIKEGDHVLDIGCANGFSTFSQIKRKPAKITGIDYASNMIAYANEAKNTHHPKDNISFEIGDIRKLQFEDNTFDVAYTTRVLINLPNWEEQLQGIQECLRVTKKGGIVIFSEAFWEPLVKLNALRTLCGLTSLTEHDFNRYLKKEKLIDFLSKNNLSFQNIEFSSLYYLGSRFLRDLVDDLEDRNNYSNTINSMFSGLEKKYSSSSGFGIQQAFVVKK
jgi:ubiquinone/menaquinone biosynthesis C-methylase UbiE